MVKQVTPLNFNHIARTSRHIFQRRTIEFRYSLSRSDFDTPRIPESHSGSTFDGLVNRSCISARWHESICSSPTCLMNSSQSRRFCLARGRKIMFISLLSSGLIHSWYLEGFNYIAQTYRATVAKTCTMKVRWLLFCTELKDRNRSPHSNGISNALLHKISDGLDQRHPRRHQCVIRQAPIIAPLLHEDKYFTNQTLVLSRHHSQTNVYRADTARWTRTMSCLECWWRQKAFSHLPWRQWPSHARYSNVIDKVRSCKNTNLSSCWKKTNNPSALPKHATYNDFNIERIPYYHKLLNDFHTRDRTPYLECSEREVRIRSSVCVLPVDSHQGESETKAGERMHLCDGSTWTTGLDKPIPWQHFIFQVSTLSDATMFHGAMFA